MIYESDMDKLEYFLVIYQRIDPTNEYTIYERRSVVKTFYYRKTYFKFQEVLKEQYLKYSIEDEYFNTDLAMLTQIASDHTVMKRVYNENVIEMLLDEEKDLFEVDVRIIK